MACRSISVSDLMLLEDWRNAAKEDNKKEMYKILFIHGMDIRRPIEWLYSEHRNLQNKIVTDYLIIGEELREDWWVKSGNASQQLLTELRRDGSLLRELNGMSGSSLVSAEGLYDSKDYEDDGE